MEEICQISLLRIRKKIIEELKEVYCIILSRESLDCLVKGKVIKLSSGTVKKVEKVLVKIQKPLLISEVKLLIGGNNRR